MRVLCILLAVAVVVCKAAPGATEDDGKVELFSGVAIEKDAAGEEKLNVKFEPGELREAARTFEEARGKIKKYTPLLAGIGVKVLAVAGLLFGALTLMVTKALVVAKLAFVVAAALGIQKLLSGGGLNSISGKLTKNCNDLAIQKNGLSFLIVLLMALPYVSELPIAGIQSSQQWTSPTASAASYPYARSSSIINDANDLAYKAQIPS